MKISMKNVFKGVIAAATAAGAGILAWQTKKSVQEENAGFDSTLSPIDEAPAEATQESTEEIPTAEAEEVKDEDQEDE